MHEARINGDANRNVAGRAGQATVDRLLGVGHARQRRESGDQQKARKRRLALLGSVQNEMCSISPAASTTELEPAKSTWRA